MDIYGLLVGLENIIIGVAVILMARPLIRGEVRRNRLYGARVKQALESDEKWKKINNFGGRQLRAWGSLILAAGIVALFIDLGPRPGLFIAFLLVPLFLLVPAWRTVGYARRLK